jgi:ATP-dependent RNA helicase RhlB
VEAENYVHRIGRTARAGKTGKAVSMASEQDVYELPDIERYIGKKIPSAFADETLLGEDKSAGMRIQVDDYDDRGRRSDRNRDSRHGDGRRVALRSEGRRREGSSSAPPRRSGPRPRPERPRAETGEGGSRQPRNDRGRDAPELAALSQEERMAYYKQKYETPARNGGNPAPGENPGNRTPREGGNRRRGGDSRSGATPRSGAAARSGADQRRNEGRSRGDGNRRPNAERSGQAKQPGKGAPAAPQTGGEARAKKGLLGRILGIFKKG